MQRFLTILAGICALLFSAMLSRALILHETGAWIACVISLVVWHIAAFNVPDDPKPLNVPAMVHDLRRHSLRQSFREAALVNALRYYAKRENWRWHKVEAEPDCEAFTSAALTDNGDKARAALAAFRAWSA